MKQVYSLNHIDIGQIAKVVELNNTGAMRRRLQDMGLIEGTEVHCVLKSPAGDLVAYQIRGAVIALRSEDSSGVKVIINKNSKQ